MKDEIQYQFKDLVINNNIIKSKFESFLIKISLSFLPLPDFLLELNNIHIENNTNG